MNKAIVFAAVLSTAAATSAFADVMISTDATQNMSCSGGVCAPTATDAVLNVTDLQNLLAAGNVEVTTTGSGVQANNIDITAAFSWSAASNLTLDAYQSIAFTAQATDSGSGGVSLVTDDGGSGGGLSFLRAGKIGFRYLNDRLTINGTRYKLESTLPALIYDIVANPKRAFALATSYNAQRDGAYASSPISIPFAGSFSGLGHSISNLEIENMTDPYTGLFADVAASGTVSGLHLKEIVIRGGGNQYVGGLAGLNEGVVANASTSGRINGTSVGGLVGYNTGTIFRSSSSATVRGSYGAGGLVSQHEGGLIAESFATGNAMYDHQQSARMDDGGLVADVFAPIRDSYAEGNLRDRSGSEDVGGLAGFINETAGGTISTSYSTGIPWPHPRTNRASGGLLGYIFMDATTISNCYWDTTTSGTDIGVGDDGDETGITGLTTSELQSGLPSGFDPSMWAEDADINNGFPYLIANPPPK